LTSRIGRHLAVSHGGARNLHINVNPGSLWHSLPPDAFLIGNTMRSTSMTDDVHFAELRSPFIQLESNLSLSEDRNAQDSNARDYSAQDYNAQDRNAPVRSAHHGQKTITEMLIGPWYLDEFGNPTREIKARD
jgi:hypothetical protein